MPSVLQHGSGAGLPAIRYDPGIALLVEGESSGRLYMLIDGEVEVLRGDTRVMVANQPGASTHPLTRHDARGRRGAGGPSCRSTIPRPV
jgi:CRP-like cAMP-binding protein